MKPHDRIDFICIGAAKAGTTWLSEVLREHARVWLPPEKELHYFNPRHGEFTDRPNPRHALSQAWYHSCFPDRESGGVIGEFSTTYLMFAEAAARIHSYHSGIKLLALLRHPIERAMSHHAFLYAQGMPIPASFSKAWSQWPNLLAHGLYFRQLEPYRRLFSAQSLMVLSYDDILRRPQYLVDRVCDFLGISRFVPTSLHKVANPTLRVRDPGRHQLISKIRHGVERWPLIRAAAYRMRLNDVFVRAYRSNLRPGPRDEVLDAKLRADLGAFFRDDVRALQGAYPETFDDWELE